KLFYTLQFEHINRRNINPYDVGLNIEASNSFVKTYLEANYRFDITQKKTFDLRLFAGGFLNKKENLPPIYNFKLSGISGTDDYLYRELYAGRFEDPESPAILSNQFEQTNGGFAVYSPLGQTSTWLISANMASSLPLPDFLPLQLFADVAFVNNPHPVVGYSNTRFFYEAGIKANIVKDFFELYFPLVMSKNIQSYSNNISGNYLQKVRFILRFEEINLFRVFRDQKNL
ncbi:MAG: hypothetical protein JW833_01435, partial [Prolixibacteraceae bacterium]|nr:hypothetical protein [Prolixibacteraceae bacterium]